MQQVNRSQAYRSSQRLGGTSPRDTEAQALLEAARRLDLAAGNEQDRDGYRTALRLNWRLWTIIQADVAADDSPLPDDIRQNILSLSVFVDKHTVGALAEPQGRKLRVLIDINRNIAAGLMTNAESSGDSVAGVSAEPARPTSLGRPVDGDIIA